MKWYNDLCDNCRNISLHEKALITGGLKVAQAIVVGIVLIIFCAGHNWFMNILGLLIFTAYIFKWGSLEKLDAVLEKYFPDNECTIDENNKEEE